MTRIHRLTGVYHADGGLLGELAYVTGKIRGTAHCSLCDITHHGLRRNPDWTAWVKTLAVPFDVVHLNERSPEVRRASAGATPCVLAHTATGVRVLLGPGPLERAAGDVAALDAALREAMDGAGLTWD